MKNSCKTVKNSFFLILFFSVVMPGWADQREENIELFLVLDKSKSMVQEIGEVTDYVDNFLLNTFLIPGDEVTILAFYGETELFFPRGNVNKQTRDSLSASLAQLKADGRFTDIGNALDHLNRLLSNENEREGSAKKRYLLLITDGIQEAPPDSPYYSPDGSFNHRFLETTKEIQRKGWKIVILGIGEDTAAREVASELDGVYREITGSLDSRSLEEATEDLLTIVSLTDFSHDLRIDKKGKATGKVILEGIGFTEPRTIVITDIIFQDSDETTLSLVFADEYPRSLEILPDTSQEFYLPLDFSQISSLEENLTGTLQFNFQTEDRFTPALVPVTIIPAPKAIPFWWFAIPFILLFLGLTVFLLIKKSGRSGRNASTSFQTISVTLDGDLKAQRVFQVRPGDMVFLKKDSFGIALVKEKVAAPLARVVIRLDEIIMDLTKDGELKALSSLEGNILDRKLSFRMKDNQRFTLQVKRKNETK